MATIVVMEVDHLARVTTPFLCVLLVSSLYPSCILLLYSLYLPRLAIQEGYKEDTCWFLTGYLPVTSGLLLGHFSQGRGRFQKTVMSHFELATEARLPACRRQSLVPPLKLWRHADGDTRSAGRE